MVDTFPSSETRVSGRTRQGLSSATRGSSAAQHQPVTGESHPSGMVASGISDRSGHLLPGMQQQQGLFPSSPDQRPLDLLQGHQYANSAQYTQQQPASIEHQAQLLQSGPSSGLLQPSANFHARHGLGGKSVAEMVGASSFPGADLAHQSHALRAFPTSGHGGAPFGDSFIVGRHTSPSLRNLQTIQQENMLLGAERMQRVGPNFGSVPPASYAVGSPADWQRASLESMSQLARKDKEVSSAPQLDWTSQFGNPGIAGRHQIVHGGGHTMMSPLRRASDAHPVFSIDGGQLSTPKPPLS